MSIPNVGISETDVPTRLKLVNLLPTTLVVAVLGIILLAGAPASRPDYPTFLANARAIGWPVLAASAVASILVSLLLQPLELASIRLLEGYWRTSGPLGNLGSFGLWIQNRRRGRLEWIQENLPSSHPENLAADQELTKFPADLPLLPTSLGNRLRSMEERAGKPYSLDIIDLWPRLYLVLPEEAIKKVDNYRNQLDISCRLCIANSFAAIASTILLFQSGPWLALPATFLLIAVLAYRAALHAATNYGDAVCATVDVHRLRLLRAAQIRLPSDSHAEIELNERLKAYWKRVGREAQELVEYHSDDDHGELSPGGQPQR